MFRFIDLFAGIGGFRKGFEAVGGRCVYTSEWNKYSRQTYLANYSLVSDIAGDISKVDVTDIPEHDVLLAGFPCQPFSAAGLRRGFGCGTQGTLFFDIARILKHHRPRAFLLENVKNLKIHDRGNTFRVIMKTLVDDLGYHVSTRVINAKSWVPQSRERIFIAGYTNRNGFSLDTMHIPTDSPRLSSILQPSRFVEPKYTLSDRLWSFLQEHAEKHRAKGNGFGYGLCGPDDVARTLTARYYKDGSEILIRQEGQNPRRLTPRECARLMGFDETFWIRVSDTQAYQQFGNSVVVPVVEAIARHMQL